MRRFLLVVILFSMLLISFGYSADQKRIAVMTLHNKADLSDQEIDYLTDLIRSGALQELPNDDFLVLTKDQIVNLIPAEKQDLKNCTGPCEMEIGRLIKATYLVSGTVMKFDDQLRLTVNLYDIESGNLLESKNASGAKTLLLESPIQKLTPPLFAKIPGSKTDRNAKKPSFLKQAVKQTLGKMIEYEEKKPAGIRKNNQ